MKLEHIFLGLLICLIITGCRNIRSHSTKPICITPVVPAQQAEELMQRVEKGDPKAALELARISRNGIDADTAVYWYGIAIKMGEVSAKHELATLKREMSSE